MNAQKLYQWFIENDVRSIGPNIDILLLAIAKEIRVKLEQVKDQELIEALEDYRSALITVVRTASTHQRAVIDKLEALVTSGKTKER